MPYMPKMLVGYTDYSPKTDESCRKCVMFQSPGECTLVIGEIDPEGWCTEFERRPDSGSHGKRSG